MRLLPEQVSRRWDIFGQAMQQSLPPTTASTKKAMINILESILLGKLECWVLTDDDETEVRAFITTQAWQDKISGSRSLLIYSFTTFMNIDMQDWKEIREALHTHALKRKCNAVIAYTTNPKVARFLENQGAKTDVTLIEMEV